MFDRFSTLAFAAVAFFFATAASAQDQPSAPQPCTLKRLASLDMTTLSTGRISVPVEIAGKTYNFILTLSGPSGISAAVTDDLKLRPYDAVDPWHGGPTGNIAGLPAQLATTVPDLRIGSIHGAATEMYVVGETIMGRRYPFPEGDVVGGVLGVKLLQNFGVELDFAQKKLNLYEPSACGPETVFWAHEAAAVPFELDQLSDVILHMQLDGKEVTVIPDMRPGTALMGSYVAETKFGIKEGSPGFERISSDKDERYRYPFKSLNLGGLAINNPNIVIYHDDAGKQCQGKQYGNHICFGGADVTVTLSQLQALHLFLSFKENMLYVTGAGARL